MARRASALVLTILVAAVATFFWSVVPAGAAPAVAGPVAGVPALVPGGPCSTEEWQNDMRGCVKRLTQVAESETGCLQAPTPTAPDSGLAGWFAERPASSTKPGPQGVYSEYGYAGYNFNTYGLGCVTDITAVDSKFENTVANGEFMIATAIIGASNALRERAWDPGELWAWADPLVDQATKAVYQ